MSHPTDRRGARREDRQARVGQVTLDNLSNEVKTAMAGGATLIWDETTNDLNAELAMRPRYGYRPEESLMLFDLDDPHASGVYVNSTSGRVNTAPDNAYRIYVVPVEGHSTLYVNGDATTSLQVSFTSRYNDPTTMANGDHLIGYISGWRANEQTRPQAGHPYDGAGARGQPVRGVLVQRHGRHLPERGHRHQQGPPRIP